MPTRSSILDFVKLARPKQWSKSVFVLVGPLYGLQDVAGPAAPVLIAGLWAALAFGLASSACYVVNDVFDAERDRVHPRKARRPIASGRVSKPAAWAFAAVLLAAAAACLGPLPGGVRASVAVVLVLYVLNVWVYTLSLKHAPIADVLSLSLGFVLRMVAGCVAAGIAPSTWLLNVTLFLAMFLSFGKRLGERRTLGEAAAAARGVQALYTDELLRMAVVVTAVATLVTYAGYVVSRDDAYFRTIPALGLAMNLLWVTTIPATYGLLRAIVLLERGTYDDPTELATRDPAMIATGLLFAAFTVLAMTGRDAAI